MKKKKIMASLVLSAMLVGTLGTSVSATAWKPEGTPGTSAVGGQGSGNGSGVVQREKTEHCFLVAVPTSMRRLSFFADPTGQTLDTTVGGTFQFQNEVQAWEGRAWIDRGRSQYSNAVTVYNAGSVPVNLTVTPVVTMRTINGAVANGYNGDISDPLLKVNVTAAVIDATATYANVDAGNAVDNAGTNFHSDPAPVASTTPLTWAREVSKDKWQIRIPAGDATDEWLRSEDLLTAAGVRYTKFSPVTLEEYNVAAKLNDELNNAGKPMDTTIAKDNVSLSKFEYPAAVFRLYGEANHEDDPTWDILDLTADLNLVWEIKDETSVAPEVEQIVVVTDLVNGNKIPVNLGKGDAAANAVTSVLWDVPGMGQMELLGTYVEYVPTSGSEGNLVIDQEALRTWYNAPDLNPATLFITMTKANGDKINLSTRVFVY